MKAGNFFLINESWISLSSSHLPLEDGTSKAGVGEKNLPTELIE